MGVFCAKFQPSSSKDNSKTRGSTLIFVCTFMPRPYIHSGKGRGGEGAGERGIPSISTMEHEELGMEIQCHLVTGLSNQLLPAGMHVAFSFLT